MKATKLDLWTHDKTGEVYILKNIVTDCTNATNGRFMALYRRLIGSPSEVAHLFVRELREFEEKFTRVPKENITGTYQKALTAAIIKCHAEAVCKAHEKV